MATRRISTRGIIFKDGKLLCQQLKPGADGKARDYWCTPGGGLNDNEALTDGLHREMIEETGIAPKIGRQLFVQQFNEDGNEYLDLFFHIENPEDYENIDLSATTHGELEISKVAFINSREYFVLPKFLQDVDIQSYIDGTLPPLIYNKLGDATKE